MARTGGPGGIAPLSTPGSDKPRAVGDDLPLDFTDLPSDRMVEPAELNPEGHRDASDVAAAEDRVAPGHRDERADRVRDVADQRADFRVPGLPDPLHHCQCEVLFAGEQMVQGTSRVTGLRCHSLQDQVGVPVAGEAARRCLQQGALGLGAPVGLGPSSGLGRGRFHVASHTDTYVCYMI